MTMDEIITRLLGALRGDEHWRAKDEALGKLPEDVYMAAHAYLRSSIAEMVATLKVAV